MNLLNIFRIVWSNTDGQGLEYFYQPKKSSKPVIAIDPIRSEIIEFLGDNITWIEPNVGTNVALMLGIAHTLVTQGKHGKVFLEKYATGYPQFEEYLTGRSDNTPRSVAWAVEITGVPEAQIVKLVGLMATNRIMLMAGWGIQRQQYDKQKHRMLVTLAMMLGQIGTPGDGFGFSYHYPNGGDPVRVGSALPEISAAITGRTSKATDDDGMTAIPVACTVDALENPGGKYQHNSKEQTYPNIKMIWWASDGSFTHHRDTNRLVKAQQKLEVIVVSEYYWAVAAKHVDIALLITTSFERNDLTTTDDYNNQYIVPMKQAVAAQFETRSDFDVFTDLAELLKPGGKEIYTEGKDEVTWLKFFYDTAQKGTRA